ncbi:MAG: Ig-like domain-containing protein [Clostridiales bacterium]|nr:Ig-like domain-containing protein [Clostridiales bacterium]
MNEENKLNLNEVSTIPQVDNTKGDGSETEKSTIASDARNECASDEIPDKKFCTKCGAELSEGQAFCPKCGQKTGEKSSINDTAEKEHLTHKKWIIPACTIALVLIAAIAAFALMGPSVEDIILSQSSIEMKVDDTASISYTISPSEASDAKVSWSSSNEDVATVGESGYITAIGEGSCIITVTAGKVSDSLSVTVKTGPDFQALYDEFCESTWASVGSDGSYLKLDTNPYNEDDSGIAYVDAYYAVISINEELGLPESLIEDMASTTAAMGKQSETYSDLDLTVSWTYHPDKGLEVTYKLEN